MANYTTNYNLKKPLTSDNYDIADQNGNMDIIDTALAAKETPTGAQAKINATVGNLSNLTTIDKDSVVDAINEINTEMGSNPSGTFTDVKTRLNDVDTKIANINTQLNNYNSYASSKDSNDIYTIIDYKRTDGTLYMKSTLSGGTSPSYTTNTWQFYNSAGTVVVSTVTWTLSYDVDGNIISKVVS